MGSTAIARRRQVLEARIEEMIALLDFLDGDADLEDDEIEVEDEHGGSILDEPHDAIDEGNDEPWLGWTDRLDQTSAHRMSGGTYDGEEDAGEEPEDTRDHEDGGIGLMNGQGTDIAVAMLRTAGLGIRVSTVSTRGIRIHRQ